MTPLDEASKQGMFALERIEQLLGEEYLYRTIDQPIDRVVSTFHELPNVPMTHEQLQRLLAEFVSRACHGTNHAEDALYLARARDESVHLLQNAYQGATETGQDAALIDARFPSGGAQVLIHHLSESLKAWRRQLHVAWVKARRVDVLDWETRCEMARSLLNELRPYLPAAVKSRDPSGFADDILLLMELRSGTAVDRLLDMTAEGAR